MLSCGSQVVLLRVVLVATVTDMKTTVTRVCCQDIGSINFSNVACDTPRPCREVEMLDHRKKISRICTVAR